MRKHAAIYITITAVLCSVMLLAAFIGLGNEGASGDFTKIAVSFYGDASDCRAFSFYTEDVSYAGLCNVQLDPADENEDSPSFGDNDNVVINAFSEYTQMVFPTQLRHMALANDLEPATKYFYRAGSKQKNKWSRWGYFITDDGDGSISFMHITDSQAKTAEDFAAFRKSMQKAYSTVGVPEFIVSTGDQVELGLSSGLWDDFFESAHDFLMQTTTAPVSGNHELVPQAVLNHFFLNNQSTLVNYSFEYGDALFVILDSNDLYMISQLEWAEAVLTNSTKKWKIVALHKAPYSSGTHADDMDVTNLRENLTPLMASCGVDIVLSGHDHVYSRTYPLNGLGLIASQSDFAQSVNGATKYYYTNPRGVFYVINRCIGTKFYGKSNDLNDNLIEKGDAVRRPKAVFSHVTIEGNSLCYTAYE
ncbi:MAG: metallophosphoesterase family protein, partial [Clostridia bacterium]|nr:metallophosphoesterase family protein [Clostridia bacterium]